MTAAELLRQWIDAGEFRSIPTCFRGDVFAARVRQMIAAGQLREVIVVDPSGCAWTELHFN